MPESNPRPCSWCELPAIATIHDPAAHHDGDDVCAGHARLYLPTYSSPVVVAA